MNHHGALTDRFESHRDHLRAIAYRMLGSLSEADDAVQEAWLRFARVDIDSVENLEAWLTTVVSRLCLDVLRARRARREDLAGQRLADDGRQTGEENEPEQEALLVDSVGRALLVVLDRLGPFERVAFVLHDMFGVPFAEIAPIVGRSSVATKKLASRARHRVRGTPEIDPAELARRRHLVEAFLVAARAGDVDAVTAVLAPDVVRRADRSALPPGRPTETRGRRAVADEIAAFGRAARFAELALVNRAPGVVVAPRGRLQLVITLAIQHDRIVGYNLIADPTQVDRLELAVLE